MAETTEAKTAKQLFQERLKAKYPDKDFSNEDEYYATSMEGYDKDHEALKGVHESNKAIYERMTKDPKSAAALSEFMSGKPLPLALKKYFSDEELALNEGDEGWEEYLEDVRTQQAKQSEYEANLENSKSEMESFAQAQGMSPDEFDEFMRNVKEQMIMPILNGLITASLLEMFQKGMNYDTDTQTAHEVGRVSGRNEKITEKRGKKSDGLPELTPSADVAPVTPAKPNKTNDAFSAIAEKSGKGNIWERGGYQPTTKKR